MPAASSDRVAADLPVVRDWLLRDGSAFCKENENPFPAKKKKKNSSWTVLSMEEASSIIYLVIIKDGCWAKYACGNEHTHAFKKCNYFPNFLYVLFMQSLILGEDVHMAVSRTIRSRGYCPSLMAGSHLYFFPLSSSVAMLSVPTASALPSICSRRMALILQ